MGTADVVGGQASGDSGRLARPPAPRASQSHPRQGRDLLDRLVNTDGAGRARRKNRQCCGTCACSDAPAHARTAGANLDGLGARAWFARVVWRRPAGSTVTGGPKKQSGCCGQRATNDRRPKYAPPARPAKALLHVPATPALSGRGRGFGPPVFPALPVGP